MKKFFYIFIFSFVLLNAQDSLVLKQINILNVQNLIKKEEQIAQEYEKFILTQFQIPTLADLVTDEYLGSNFSLRNTLGGEISFENARNLRITFAVTRDLKEYVYALYRRDLYRDRTTAVISENSGVINTDNSFVLIELKSQEAQNIYDLLLSGAIINPNCDGVIVSRYCNQNDTSIRWYNSSSNWIEYDKKEFNQGNVTIKNVSVLSDSKLNDLAVGSYIYEENGDKYIKLLNNEIKEVK